MAELTEDQAGPPMPEPVSEALGYDPKAVPKKLVTARLFQNRERLWPLVFIIAGAVIGIELGYYYLRGWFDGVSLQQFGQSFVQVFWFDVIQSVLIAYLLIGAEMVRRGFACQLRQLGPALSAPVVSEHLIGHRGNKGRYAAGLILVAINVPASVYVVANQPQQFDILHIEVMVLRLSTLMMLVGICMYDLIAMTVDFSRIVRERLAVNLLDMEPLQPISRFALRSTMFLMIGLAISIPMVLDGPTIIQTASILSLVLVCSLVILMLPVRAARQKIKEAKQAEEARIAPLIERGLRMATQRRENMAALHDQVALAGLLNWRREVRETREWVLDFDTMIRVILLIMVPVGGWVGSELAEEIIDRLVGG